MAAAYAGRDTTHTNTEAIQSYIKMGGTVLATVPHPVGNANAAATFGRRVAP